MAGDTTGGRHTRGDGAPEGGPEPHEADGDFASMSDRYRPELLAYCYRMLGSFHDAEDLVQETYLRAWRSYAGFEGRASVRTWLYRIATNACLSALEHHSRRTLPSGLNGGDSPEESLDPSAAKAAWLHAAPDTGMAQGTPDPAAVVEERSSFRLALIAALRYLPARQRAVFILREALAMPATEVARLLDTSVAAVKSALQRARTQLVDLVPAEDELNEPADPAVRSLIDRYVAAFDTDDLAALVTLLTQDVIADLPPSSAWFASREDVSRPPAKPVPAPPDTFAAQACDAATTAAAAVATVAAATAAATSELRATEMTATEITASDLTATEGTATAAQTAPAPKPQPSVSGGDRAEDGVHRAHTVMVLTLARVGSPLTGGRSIRRISTFREPSLLAAFGLPEIRPVPVG